MRDFDFRRARSVAEAVGCLRDGSDSKLIAGGQSLLASMKLGLMAPERLVDLGGIAELREGRALGGGELWLGAMQTHGMLARDPLLRSTIPGLAALAGHIADEQVRGMGTIGGSMANADPAACWPAGLLALGAVLHTDRREIPIDDFLTGLFGTALEPDEILCGIRVRKPRRMVYRKFEQAASRFALVGVAVAELDDGAVRVALTGTSQGAVRLPAFEQALARRLSPDSLRGLAVDEALMSSDVHAPADYRAHLAAVMARRAVASISGE
ncbi:xanthine dehydrogenase family protein subunit M [Pelomonas sp. KK5]|uniref:FAD binding domain-containing protein n=1 Tax=Pelomonas sp. KK5 TaxID=1855730 RepID=UPI00097C54E7|nr:xanthine dehydrogenase family protein subunit M [Pelomonas sp. KK5]